MLKGAFQIQTWPSSSFWNDCWWLWHNPNVSGTCMHLKCRNNFLFIVIIVMFFPLMKHFNDFKNVIYTFFFLYIFWFQLIRAILQNPKDKINVHLIYANVTLEDILLKVICLHHSFYSLFFWDELDSLVQLNRQKIFGISSG